MNSEIIGKPTDVPWAFLFKRETEHELLVPRHPSQLYEALSCLILFIVLMWIWNKKKQYTREGLLTGVFMIVVFTLRFFYEFLKENQSSFEDSMAFNMGQYLSIPAVLFGIGVLVYAFRKKPETIQ
ncbi:prolipoprotein diacylglyceryl transferase [Pseudarcicella hirudinis]